MCQSFFLIKVGGGLLGGLLLEDAVEHVVDNSYDDGFRDGTWSPLINTL